MEVFALKEGASLPHKHTPPRDQTLPTHTHTPIWWPQQVACGGVAESLVELEVADVEGAGPLLEQRFYVLREGYRGDNGCGGRGRQAGFRV